MRSIQTNDMIWAEELSEYSSREEGSFSSVFDERIGVETGDEIEEIDNMDDIGDMDDMDDMDEDFGEVSDFLEMSFMEEVEEKEESPLSVAIPGGLDGDIMGETSSGIQGEMGGVLRDGLVEESGKVPRRRQIDPTTCERDYSDAEIEFMTALDEYKRNSGRMFPTCSEILEVLLGLGYTKNTHKPAEPLVPEPPRPVQTTVTPTFATESKQETRFVFSPADDYREPLMIF